MKCLFCEKDLKSSASKFCSNKCQKDTEYQQYVIRWKSGFESGNRGSNTQNISAHVVRYILEKYKRRCAECGWCRVNAVTGVSPLEINHIDGNANNTSEKNLIVLCPNCHSLTENYKNLNKGHGRLWRKQKYAIIPKVPL